MVDRANLHSEVQLAGDALPGLHRQTQGMKVRDQPARYILRRDEWHRRE
jgi:hypothetical protein